MSEYYLCIIRDEKTQSTQVQTDFLGKGTTQMQTRGPMESVITHLVYNGLQPVQLDKLSYIVPVPLVTKL
jgi:hypothetical protein